MCPGPLYELPQIPPPRLMGPGRPGDIGKGCESSAVEGLDHHVFPGVGVGILLILIQAVPMGGGDIPDDAFHGASGRGLDVSNPATTPRGPGSRESHAMIPQSRGGDKDASRASFLHLARVHVGAISEI